MKGDNLDHALSLDSLRRSGEAKKKLLLVSRIKLFQKRTDKQQSKQVAHKYKNLYS